MNGFIVNHSLWLFLVFKALLIDWCKCTTFDLWKCISCVGLMLVMQFVSGGQKNDARLHVHDTPLGAFDGSLICRRSSATLLLKADLDKLVFLSPRRLMSLPRLQAGTMCRSWAGCEQHLFAFRVTFAENSTTTGTCVRFVYRNNAGEILLIISMHWWCTLLFLFFFFAINFFSHD